MPPLYTCEFPISREKSSGCPSKGKKRRRELLYIMQSSIPYVVRFHWFERIFILFYFFWGGGDTLFYLIILLRRCSSPSFPIYFWGMYRQATKYLSLGHCQLAVTWQQLLKKKKLWCQFIRAVIHSCEEYCVERTQKVPFICSEDSILQINTPVPASFLSLGLSVGRNQNVLLSLPCIWPPIGP